MSEQDTGANGTTLSRGAVTLKIDLDAFINDVWNDDDEAYHNELMGLVASKIATSLQKDIAVAVRDKVGEQVEQIVRETLDGGVRKVSAWGEPTGETTSLRDLIGKTAEDALRKPELRDGYSRGAQPTMVQRIIAKEVEAAFKKEIQGHVKEAQAAAVAAVKKSAAEVIGETIDRARRGLA